MNVEYILDYPVTTEPVDKCVAQIMSWISSGKTAKYLACVNPHSVIVAQNDPEFSQAIREADLTVPDGIGIVIASKILGGIVRKRICGPDIFSCLHTALNRSAGVSVFFLGSTEETLASIREKMACDYPNIRVAGTYSPPFKSEFTYEDDQKMIDAVNTSQPDILWVGMTAPKQEKWIYRNRGKLNVTFIGAIGAMFDFYTGKVKRPHPAIQKFGLDWFARLLQDPRRLWRRNFISNPLFMIRVLKARFFITQ